MSSSIQLLGIDVVAWLDVQGEMKLQIDRMIAKFFSSLPVDEQLNFSVAVTVMSVQRKWRQRMKAHKVCSLPMSAVLCQAAPQHGCQ